MASGHNRKKYKRLSQITLLTAPNFLPIRSHVFTRIFANLKFKRLPKIKNETKYKLEICSQYPKKQKPKLMIRI